MGFDVKIKTENILNAYLTLGLLEINKDERNDNSLKQKEILEKIDQGDISEPNYIGRFLDDVEEWLKKDTGLNENQIRQIIIRGHGGFKLIANLPSSAYRDYIGAFLHLALIEDGKHTDYVDDIINKKGEKALSIITKLVIAKRGKKSAEIEYFRDNNVTIITHYKPIHFSLENNRWIIAGKVDNADIKLELSKIHKIKLPPNTPPFH